MAKAPRVGHAMRELADIVSACPGISKSAALRATGRPVKGMGCWRLIERSVGVVIIEDTTNPWVRRPAHALFASERDRTMFNLRQELLRGQPTPERAGQIVAEIDRLRAEQFADYAEGTAR